MSTSGDKSGEVSEKYDSTVLTATTALAEHVCETSHNIAWNDSTTITTNNRYGQRLCLEA